MPQAKAPSKGVKVSPAGLARKLRIHELRSLFLDSHGAEQDGFRSAKGRHPSVGRT